MTNATAAQPKAFNPSMIVPLSKSTEFKDAKQERTPKTILIEGIAKQIALLGKPSDSGRRWFTLGKSEAAIELRLANRPLKLAGDETKVVVPTEHAEAAFKHYKAEVEKGTFDDQIAELGKMLDERKDKLRTTREAKRAKQPTIA